MRHRARCADRRLRSAAACKQCGRTMGGKYNCGTVFSVTASGSEKVRYSFARGTDGYQPVTGLIAVSGTLYGTTSQGGAYGYGTVFRWFRGALPNLARPSTK
ncbi:MAG: choice-of-anchor tandem repeat GloVer-containing protein [Candidatus Cybelea sp.]